jgi:hypothetical protein
MVKEIGRSKIPFENPILAATAGDSTSPPEPNAGRDSSTVTASTISGTR